MVRRKRSSNVTCIDSSLPTRGQPCNGNCVLDAYRGRHEVSRREKIGNAHWVQRIRTEKEFKTVRKAVAIRISPKWIGADDQLIGIADPVAVRIQADGFAVNSLRSASEDFRGEMRDRWATRNSGWAL